MKKPLHVLFKQAQYYPEDQLVADVWHAILAQKIRKARMNFYGMASFGLLSFVALFPIIHDTLLQLKESGVYEYFSLVFTDSSSIALYWKEFILSIADVTPMTSVLVSCSLVFIFFLCVSRALLYKHQLQVI